LKRLAALLVAVLFSLSCVQIVFGDEAAGASASASASPAPDASPAPADQIPAAEEAVPADRVEITFRVGDSVLMINGSPVEVETPYVKDGVTLVPVRVITEAFGATVGWDGDARKITIDYLDVEIVLTIGSLDVSVNGQTQTLLYPPEISGERTMVPLRFISENFGADVGWNEDTKEITVVRSLAGDSPVDVGGVLNPKKPNVGDSYYNWSIGQPTDMELSYRSFDGRDNNFSFDDEVYLEIYFDNNSGDETFDQIQTEQMNYAKNYTLIGQKVLKTASGAEYVRTQYRDSGGFHDERAFLLKSGDILYISLDADISLDGAARDRYVALADTFDFKFNPDTTDDLSDVADGMRSFDDKDFRIALKIPADWRDYTNSDQANVFSFVKYDKDYSIQGSLNLSVYSKGEGDTIEKWAARDLSKKSRYANPSLMKFGAVSAATINGVNAQSFQFESKTGGTSKVGKNIYWEYRHYFYSLSVTVLKDESDLIRKIVNSVSFEEIDPGVVGELYLDTGAPDAGKFTTVKNASMKYSVDVPASWTNSSGGSVYGDMDMGIIVMVNSLGNLALDEKAAEDAYNRIINGEAATSAVYTSVKSPAAISPQDLASGLYSGYMFEVQGTYNGYTANVLMYLISDGSKSFMITAAVTEEYYSPASLDVVAKIVRSFTIG